MSSRLQMCIQNPVKHLRWSVFNKKINGFSTIFRVLNMPLDYLSCFAVVLRGILGNFDICETDYSIHSKLQNFPLFWSHTWKYSNQVNERLTKAKEKWSIIQFDVFVLSFSLFECPSKCHTQKRCVLVFTRIRRVARVLCAPAIARIKCRRLFLILPFLHFHFIERV